MNNIVNHILIISPYRYTGEDIGSGTFIDSQVNGFKKLINKIGVIAPSPKVYRGLNFKKILKSFFTILPNIKIEDGVPVIRFNGLYWMTSRIPYVSTTYWCLIGLIQFIIYVKKFGKPQLIHAHDSVYAGELALFIKFLYKIPVIITEHNSNLTEKKSYKLIRKKRYVLRSCNYVIMVSNNLYNLHLDNNCLDINKTIVLPNVLDDFFEIELDHKRVHKFNDEFAFIHVSHMTKIKNIDSLIKAFKIFIDKHPKSKLVIVGSGYYLNDLIKLVQDLGIIKNIEFVGLKNRSEIIEYYRNSDAFILSSFYETFGYVLVEAMSVGIPVIAVRNSGGPDEIITSKVGLLADNHTDIELYNSMIKLYENYSIYNPNEIKLYCKENYSSTYIIPEIIKCYNKILNT